MTDTIKLIKQDKHINKYQIYKGCNIAPFDNHTINIHKYYILVNDKFIEIRDDIDNNNNDNDDKCVYYGLSNNDLIHIMKNKYNYIKYINYEVLDYCTLKEIQLHY